MRGEADGGCNMSRLPWCRVFTTDVSCAALLTQYPGAPGCKHPGARSHQHEMMYVYTHVTNLGREVSGVQNGNYHTG